MLSDNSGVSSKYNPIICAIDTSDIEQAINFAMQLKDCVAAIKLGLEFFIAHGPSGVRALEKTGLPIFLDLKLHDIPNTVAGAIQSMRGLDIFMLTIHIAGGKTMMQSALSAAHELAGYSTKKRTPLVVGVTVLTSLDQQDISAVGVGKTIDKHVEDLALFAQESGLDGVVCSPREIGNLRNICGDKFKLVTPGIRPTGSICADQKRVLTPAQAVKLGADYLVIGRPITKAACPKTAAMEILHSI